MTEAAAKTLTAAMTVALVLAVASAPTKAPRIPRPVHVVKSHLIFVALIQGKMRIGNPSY